MGRGRKTCRGEKSNKYLAELQLAYDNFVVLGKAPVMKQCMRYVRSSSQVIMLIRVVDHYGVALMCENSIIGRGGEDERTPHRWLV